MQSATIRIAYINALRADGSRQKEMGLRRPPQRLSREAIAKPPPPRFRAGELAGTSLRNLLTRVGHHLPGDTQILTGALHPSVRQHEHMNNVFALE